MTIFIIMVILKDEELALVYDDSPGKGTVIGSFICAYSLVCHQHHKYICCTKNYRYCQKPPVIKLRKHQTTLLSLLSIVHPFQPFLINDIDNVNLMQMLFPENCKANNKRFHHRLALYSLLLSTPRFTSTKDYPQLIRGSQYTICPQGKA